MLKEILKHKLKIILFFIGYILMIIDIGMTNDIVILMSSIDKFYLLIFNLFFIFLAYKSLKIMLEVFTEITIVKSDKTISKIFSSLKLISIGAFIGFITIIGQAFIIAFIG